MEDLLLEEEEVVEDLQLQLMPTLNFPLLEVMEDVLQEVEVLLGVLIRALEIKISQVMVVPDMHSSLKILRAL